MTNLYLHPPFYLMLNVKQSLLFRWLVLKHSIMKEWIIIVKMNPLPIIFEHYPPFITKNRNLILIQ